jgi:uncharacterized protein YcfL
MKKLEILIITLAILGCGCAKKQSDPRINVREGVASDTLGSNIVTRPVTHAFSTLIGEGLDITDAVIRKTGAGLLELYVSGYNNSYSTKRFQYRVEWLDKDGLPIESKATTWLSMSATGKNNFSFRVAATSPKAVDFRMDTRKQE